MIEPRPEERNHVCAGPVLLRVRVGEIDAFCLTRKKTRSLIWTADVANARKIGLPPGNKGDFLGWIENTKIVFRPTTA